MTANRTSRDAGGKAKAAILFSYGFRAFFAGATSFAAISMALWLAVIADAAHGAGLGTVLIGPIPLVWHAHEMVYGFAMAAVAGFLLTAVPNWTGALPASGRPLIALFALWLAGRIAMLVSPLLPVTVVAMVDLAFVPALAVIAVRQLLVKPQPRNLIFLVLLLMLTLANAHFHVVASGLHAGDPTAGVKLALAVIVMMIIIIGGRIVPAFTHNYLHSTGTGGAMPKRDARLDAATIALSALALLAWGLSISGPLVVLMLALAGVVNALRLALWHGIAARRAPIVWILHIGYAWIVVGLALAALADAAMVTPVAATHAFGAGAAGTMIIAVMSRASLGHTGRKLVAAPLTIASYWLVTASAVLRVGAALTPTAISPMLMMAAALAWIAAFTLFARVYLPILTAPRARGEHASG